MGGFAPPQGFPAADVIIGSPIVGGGANRVLFEDASQNLSSDSAFTYVSASGLLTVANITLSATGVLKFGTDIGLTKIAAGVLGHQLAGTQQHLRIYDSTPTNYLNLTHDGTNGVIFPSAGHLALRNGTTAQTFRITNTYTSDSNLETMELGWTSNVFHIWSVALGGGSARALVLGNNATGYIGFGSNANTAAQVQSTFKLGWSPSSNLTTNPDTGYERISAGIFAHKDPMNLTQQHMRVYEAAGTKYVNMTHDGTDAIIFPSSGVLSVVNSTTAQTFRVYGTTTGPKYIELKHDGTNAILDHLGGELQLTASGADLKIQSGLGNVLYLNNQNGMTGGIRFGSATNNSTSGSINTFYNTGTLADTGTNSTTEHHLIHVAPVINFTGATRTGRVIGAFYGCTATSMPTGQNAAIAMNATAASTWGGLMLENDYTSDTNYSIGRLYFTSNVLTLATLVGSSGTARDIRMTSAGGNIYFNTGADRLQLSTSALGFTTGISLAFATSGAGTKIGTGTTQLMGFWNATPIVQPSSTGETTGWTSGGGTAATSTDTYTGNTGTKAYTLNDVVKHLKTMGLLASS